jgi:hypothetical protein
VLVEVSRDAARWLEANDLAAVLIRPDRYILTVIPENFDASAAIADFDKLSAGRKTSLTFNGDRNAIFLLPRLSHGIAFFCRE